MTLSLVRLPPTGLPLLSQPVPPTLRCDRASVQGREYTLRHHVLRCGSLPPFADSFSSFDNFFRSRPMAFQRVEVQILAWFQVQARIPADVRS